MNWKEKIEKILAHTIIFSTIIAMVVLLIVSTLFSIGLIEI